MNAEFFGPDSLTSTDVGRVSGIFFYSLCRERIFSGKRFSPRAFYENNNKTTILKRFPRDFRFRAGKQENFFKQTGIRCFGCTR
jgi:hypothetical protein